MRTLWEAIQDTDDRIDTKLDSYLAIRRMAEELINAFGKATHTIDMWSGDGIAFDKYTRNTKGSAMLDPESYATPLQDVKDEVQTLIDKFKAGLKKIRGVKNIKDAFTNDNDNRSTRFKKSSIWVMVEFDKKLDMPGFSFEFVFEYTSTGHRKAIDIRNIPEGINFVEMYSRVFSDNQDNVKQLKKIIEELV